MRWGGLGGTSKAGPGIAELCGIWEGCDQKKLCFAPIALRFVETVAGQIEQTTQGKEP